MASNWVFSNSHQCNTLACADAGPVCQITSTNQVFILCDWVGKLEWRSASWRGAGKKIILGRENHFLKLERGDCCWARRVVVAGIFAGNSTAA